MVNHARNPADCTLLDGGCGLDASTGAAGAITADDGTASRSSIGDNGSGQNRLPPVLHRHTLRRMVGNFRCKDTRQLWEVGKSCRFASISFVALRKLAMLDAAETLEDLRVPPASRLEAHKGDRKGYHSIRVNDQWRLCFQGESGRALDVEIAEYH